MSDAKITPEEAVIYAQEEHDFSVEISTIRNWVKKYGIGVKIGGRLYINKKRLTWILEGKLWKIPQADREESRKKAKAKNLKEKGESQ